MNASNNVICKKKYMIGTKLRVIHSILSESALLAKHVNKYKELDCFSQLTL